MYHEFSVLETVKTSWDIFKKNVITIIVYSVISFIALAILAVLVEFLFSPEDFAAKMGVSLILIFLQAYTTLGLYKLIFTVIDSEYYEFELRQVFPGIKMILSYLGVIFLLAFITTNFSVAIDRLDNYPNLQFALKTILVFIALYFALRIMFFNTFIVDDKSGPLESLKQSFELTKGYFLKVLIILIIIVLFIAVPAILSEYFPLTSLIIIFTYPFVNIILAVTYRKLVYSHLDVDDEITETL
ncbi:MAG: hypothetical protein JWR09_1983 [Mucilaginibacter sp.]|nr:hypothetical protein [Mucilaginibacter sp.]